MQSAFSFSGVEDIQPGVYEPCSLSDEDLNLSKYSSYCTRGEVLVLNEAESILRRIGSKNMTSISSPKEMSDLLTLRLAHLMHEEFHIVHLTNRHRVINIEMLFRGTVDGASVHPREVVRSCLAHNTAALVMAHGHPGGIPEPSASDRAITEELKLALHYIGVRVLDHIVVASGGCVSMASRGLI